ncbi:M48 family metallopeptidase [Myxacorys almedinensis]|uniref:M48 family metalloprotease n=1 Tax=Myxacorys almedinensis A TaxID=2690445 RepID=A0A8J7Z241_9CYAN|nr:M48 family metallopeptidase [Myxacorys almedinensis]NDJ18249.1 M48 family metalloprotease [Myxacorys almedinensis A]
MPTYPGISSAAFRHPLDYQAEQTLRSVPGFDLVARKFIEFVYERPRLVYLTGNSIQVGVRQYSSIYQIFRECLQSLDIASEPALFVSQAPLVNAYALGQERPCVVLNTALLDLLSEAELRSVIAHELGHLKCGHTTLTQMAMWVNMAIAGLADFTFGLSNLISTGLLLSFYEWLRKAELSADRAALLVMDDLNPVLYSMMRLAGGSQKYAHELSIEEFAKQSDRYHTLDQDNLNQVYKFFLYNDVSSGIFLTHPFTVERVRYLQEWSTSPEFQQIRQGTYSRAGSEGAVNVDAQPEDAVHLRQQIEELQQEIDRLKRPQ